MGKINHWTRQEIDILLSNYSESTNYKMQSLLPFRTYDSIKQKAMSLGLKKNMREEHSPTLNKHSRMIDSGIITRTGNLTIHRMI